MARKTKEEALKTRESILDSALNLFYEKGYSKSSLVDIAKELNLSKGAVYWHFESKHDLLFTLVKGISEKIDKILTPVAQKVKSIDDLKNLFKQYAKLIANDDEVSKFFTVLIYKIEWNEELKDVTELLNDDELVLFCEYILKRLQKKGVISKETSPSKMAKILISMFNGIIYESALDEDFLDNIDSALGIFFNGIKS
jgi:TetR/AcrR family acrAB operon transcriptional repressor